MKTFNCLCIIIQETSCAAICLYHTFKIISRSYRIVSMMSLTMMIVVLPPYSFDHLFGVPDLFIKW